MEDILFSVVAKVAEYLVYPIARPIGYVWNYKSNFDNLKKEVENLASKRDTLRHSVRAATRNGREIEQKVNIWLGRVETMIAEATEVILENEHANMKCFKGLCPNPKKRYQHSREAAKKGKAVAELRGEGNFTGISYSTIPKDNWIPSHKGYEDFKSRLSVFNNIKNVLSNPAFTMIGIYGTGGIGKTTLARNVAAHAEENNLFNVVAFAEVTMKPDIKEIQQEIADKLGLTFREGSASGRARSLQQRLMQEEKVLLILDNIWEWLKLEEVGIPFGDDHKGCKVLLTARSLNVLLKMQSQSNFQVGFLEEGEAWSLFKKTAGDCIENNVPIQGVAIEVAKACGGLPIAITSVAVALRGNEEVPVWKDALIELKRPSATSFEGVAAETYASIEISYNKLRREELKSIFLLCSIMGHTSIEDLLAYGMGLGMFQGTQTIEEARNRVIALTQQLKGSSLLLDANNETFSLHDVVRDVARSIASRDGHMIVETGSVIPRESMEKHLLRKCIKISLHAINELPIELECPQLEFLYMKSEKELSKVPNNFFTRMPQLKVLHLDGMDLDSVSNSLFFLVKLQTLNLVSCNLYDFHFFGELKQLKFLRIRANDFWELPKDMCNLSELRLLNLNDCDNLRDIPPNIISTLTHLEGLYLRNCFRISNSELEVAEFKNLNELNQLSFFTTLELGIPDASVLPKGNFLSKKLQRYKIFLGSDNTWGRSYFSSRELNLNLIHPSWSEYIPDKITSVEEFLSILNTEGFPELEVLVVQYGSWFRTVFECLKSESCDPFPFMKSLMLWQLRKLEKISNYQLKANSFGRLTSVQIGQCNNLKNIFSFSTNRVLPLLQDLRVSFCDNMEEIFAVGGEVDINNDEGTDQIEFKQLRRLSLRHLPKLTNFCRMSSNEGCAGNPLFNQKVALPSLETIEICIMVNLEMIWPNRLCNYSFCNLKSMGVWGCKKLLTIFQSNILERITRLESLEVKECDLVQNIFDLQETDLEESHPQIEILLQKLYLDDLPNLEHIWIKDSRNRFSFKKLENVEVYKCRSLKYLFPISIAKSLPELKNLRVDGCGMEKLVEDEGEAKEAATFVFPQVISLELSSLCKLKTFYQGEHTSQWPNLKELHLGHFDNLELFASEFFDFQVSNEGQQSSIIMVKKDPFPNLEKLVIHGSVMLILQCQVPEHLCCKIKFLEVRSDKSVVFPLGMFQRFRNLHKLCLVSCSYQVLDSYEQAEILDPSVSKCDSKLDTVLHKIESLSLESCDDLIQLASSSVSFQNLTFLNVAYCRRLKNLVMSSTARSLVQLREMKICDCESMIEVVAKEEDETEDNIIFTKLRILTLEYVSSLTCFCSGNYTIELPSLEELNLHGCPKMKNFSSGDVTTPMLRKLTVGPWRPGEDCRLEGDLNTTIQELQHSRKRDPF